MYANRRRFRSGVYVPRFAAARRLGFRLEFIFDDLAIERAAADIKHARRLLLVPVHRLEYPDDVRALRFGKRGQALARLLAEELVSRSEFWPRPRLSTGVLHAHDRPVRRPRKPVFRTLRIPWGQKSLAVFLGSVIDAIGESDCNTAPHAASIACLVETGRAETEIHDPFGRCSFSSSVWRRDSPE